MKYLYPSFVLLSLWTNIRSNHKKQNIFSNFFFWDKVRVKSISLEQKYDVHKYLFRQGQTQYLVFRYRIYLDSFRTKCLMWIWINGFVDIGYEPYSIGFLFQFLVPFVSFLNKGKFSVFCFPVDEKLMASHWGLNLLPEEGDVKVKHYGKITSGSNLRTSDWVDSFNLIPYHISPWESVSGKGFC